MKEFKGLYFEPAKDKGSGVPTDGEPDAVAKALAEQRRLLEEVQLRLALDKARVTGEAALMQTGSLTEALGAYAQGLGSKMEVTIDPDTGAQVLSFVVIKKDIPGASEGG